MIIRKTFSQFMLEAINTVIATSGPQLGVVDKKDNKVVPGSFRVPTDSDLTKVDMNKFRQSSAGQKFMQQKDAAKTTGFKPNITPGASLSSTPSSTSSISAPKPAPAPANTVISVPKPTPQTTSSSPSLDDLRTASARATMAGPSKEAQSLMSTRAKNLIGQSKLDAGIKAQQGVETMKSRTRLG
jgi:hypothetical protein